VGGGRPFGSSSSDLRNGSEVYDDPFDAGSYGRTSSADAVDGRRYRCSSSANAVDGDRRTGATDTVELRVRLLL
jgi:hypothetical protein